MMQLMKTILTFTCMACGDTYDKEIDINGDKANDILQGDNTMYIGICHDCVNSNDVNIRKTVAAFMKRNEKALENAKHVM